MRGGSIRLLVALAATAVATAPEPAEAQEEPRGYEALRATAPPVIDGALDDAAWASAPWTDPFVDIAGGHAPVPRYRTRAKLLWDDAHLYVAAELEEPHLWATLTEHDAIVYRDDDFEVFLDPEGDGLRYFEVEINALGTVLDLFLERPYKDGGRAELAWDLPGLLSAVSMDGSLNDPSDTDRGWAVEMAIPWDELVPLVAAPGPDSTAAGWTPGQPPRPGDVWRVNFSRVDWPLEVVDGGYVKAALPSRNVPHPEDNWVWSPQGVVNMHVPEHWGFVRFVESVDGGGGT